MTQLDLTPEVLVLLLEGALARKMGGRDNLDQAKRLVTSAALELAETAEYGKWASGVINTLRELSLLDVTAKQVQKCIRPGSPVEWDQGQESQEDEGVPESEGEEDSESPDVTPAQEESELTSVYSGRRAPNQTAAGVEGAILEALAAGVSKAEAARRFGVSRRTVIRLAQRAEKVAVAEA